MYKFYHIHSLSLLITSSIWSNATSICYYHLTLLSAPFHATPTPIFSTLILSCTSPYLKCVAVRHYFPPYHPPSSPALCETVAWSRVDSSTLWIFYHSSIWDECKLLLCIDSVLELHSPTSHWYHHRYIGQNGFMCSCDWLSLIRIFNKYQVAIADVGDTPSCDDSDLVCGEYCSWLVSVILSIVNNQ